MKRSRLLVGAVAVLMGLGTCIAQAQPAPANAPGAPAGRGGRGGFGGQGGRGGFGRGFPTGPAAPVPPEVAQPSAAQITQMNDALKQFIASNSSPAKDLLQKYESMILLPPPRQNVAATYTETNVRGASTGQGPSRHDAFVERAKQGDIDILFEGDSITDWWTQGEEKKAMFDKYFGGLKVANFAVAGDTTQGVLWGLQNGEGQGFQPKAIMMMIGTNNLGGNTPQEIAEGIGAIVLENRKDFPNAKILLLAVFPRGTPNDPSRDRIAQINKIIQKLDDKQHVFYMDIGAKFLGPDGAFLPDSFQGDNLHPAPKGYDIWGAAVADTLKGWLK